MARTAVPPVTIRTTIGGGGAHGVIAGLGTTPALALADLRKRAQATAEQIVAATVGADGTAPTSATELPEPKPLEPQEPGPGAPGPAPTFAFEVVGVLLTFGLLEDGYPGWCAYGTLQTAMPDGSVVA